MTSELPELLPCPFCKGTAIAEEYQHATRPADYEYEARGRVDCDVCGARITGDTLVEAIAAWNTRAQPTGLTEGERGMVLVPREPTYDQLTEGSRVLMLLPEVTTLPEYRDQTQAIYRAMIATAPNVATERAIADSYSGKVDSFDSLDAMIADATKTGEG